MSKRKSNKNNLANILWQQIFKPILKNIIRLLGNASKIVSRKAKKYIASSQKRAFLKSRQRRQFSQAGFVLPTVTMVMLVVILLTIAISLRSFDRAQDARNVRVNQAVLSAASPALDRAKAKIQYLLNEDPALPRETPTDDSINDFLNTTTYEFGGEERLQVRFDLPALVNPGSVNAIDEDGETDILEDDEVMTTAWRFPVDTDNNGVFDSFTLYGIFFRSPARDTNGNLTTTRQPLDARTPPMTDVEVSSRPECQAAGTSSSLVGDSGWYQSGGNLKKSFFVYTTTVPITDKAALGLGADTDYEDFTGTRGLSALEYQQDQTRIPLTNNAVVYEDDLEIAPGPEFRLNGRIHTNSNFIVTAQDNPFTLYQVSGVESCFYNAENAKIVVGGNVVNGTLEDTVRQPVTVHLHGNPITTAQISQSAGVQSVTNATTAVQVAYNTDAYAQRLEELIEALCQPDVTGDCTTTGPTQVDDAVVLAIGNSEDPEEARKDAIELYFRERLRKVPFAEVAPGDDALGTFAGSPLQGSGDSVRPPNDWVWPTADGTPVGGVDTGSSGGSMRSELSLKMAHLAAIDPDSLEEDEEEFLGDRVLVGNNLPEKRWWNDDFINTLQYYDGDAVWYTSGDTVSSPTSTSLRYREPQVVQLADVGAMDRDGFWEVAAATEPEAPLDAIGGLRLITGAGIYERRNSFLPPPNCYTCTIDTSGTYVKTEYDDPDTAGNTEEYEVVWPDTMPMSPIPDSQVYDNETNTWYDLDSTEWGTLDTAAGAALTGVDPNTRKYAKGDLRMRATVLYHYAQDPGAETEDNQEPIACISSYYDPTDTNTVRNLATLDDVSGWDAADVLAGWTGATYRPPGTPTARTNPKSNNGIVYPPPSTTRPTSASTVGSNGLLTGGSNSDLEDQANMVFPDGRFANEPLREALQNVNTTDYSLADQAAIDAALCSIDILEGNIVPNTTPTTGITIPHGTIKEISLLNPREVKSIEKDNATDEPVTFGGRTFYVDETFTLDGGIATDLNADDYNLPLEERQPLEIRVTQLDLDRMRQIEVPFATGVVGPTNINGNEFLLPYSGIIYASRDDALPDLSDSSSSDPTNPSQLLSATDLKLDPTRRPNGIMLINGQALGRIPVFARPLDIDEVVKEKGLTLVSNEPVYIQGDFNRHQDSSGNLLEEFQANLNATWSNFYQRSGTGTDVLDPNFACRTGDARVTSGTGCDGDLWRPVNVLADAVTLLSENFRPGVRNEGDFDLRNNAGNGAVVALDGEDNFITAKQARRFNGFMVNDFAVNGLSSNKPFTVNGNDGATGANLSRSDANYRSGGTAIDSSYFNNFVTPVQRRINFPEYLMEMCTKLPVSECSPDDWIVGIGATGTEKAYELDGTNETLNNIRAGTTRKFVGRTTVEDQRFPRRVAFLRNEYNLLELSQVGTTGNYTAIPMGLTGRSGGGASETGDIQGFNYPSVPQPANNSLWFRTTSNTDGLPHCSRVADTNPIFTDSNCTADNINYTGANPLYYLPPNFDADFETPVNQWQMPEFETLKLGNWPLLPNTPEIEIAGTDYSLGSADDYAVCNSDDTASNIYEIDASTPETCSASDVTSLYNALDTTLTMDGDATVASGKIEINADPADSDGIIAYNIPASIDTETDVDEIVLTGDRNTVFVIKRAGDLDIGSSTQPVTLTLNGGVDPNNIFWVVNGNLGFADGQIHRLAGNFLGTATGTVTIGNQTKILGGRFLGFSAVNINAPAAGSPPPQEITAMTTQAQPVLVPVLQIHAPSGGIGSSGRNTEWMMNADPTTFNLVVGTRDVPSRPTGGAGALTPGESNGGLQNLPRFLGNWGRNDSAASIRGTFIQLGRSEFATAPYQQIIDEDATPPIESVFPGTESDDYDIVYSSGAARGLNGYQSAPNRDWGFDVGMLSQSADLFAQKSTIPSSNSTPDEFFREVSQDDPWIKALLCAKDNGGTTDAINRPGSLDCDGYE